VSLVVLASAKGAPGVSVASLALAAVWPRPVLVAECDTSGGDLAPRWGLRPTPSLLTLAAAARRQLSVDELWRHTQRLPSPDGTGQAAVLVGPPAAEQAMALGRLWGALGPALAQLPDADVLADCGRLVPGAPSAQLLGHATLVLLVSRPSPEGIAHARTRLLALQQVGVEAGLVLVGERPYGLAEVREALDAARVRPVLVAVLADDPRAAAMLAGEPGSQRRLASSLLIRSARTLVDTLPHRWPVTTSPQRAWAEGGEDGLLPDPVRSGGSGGSGGSGDAPSPGLPVGDAGASWEQPPRLTNGSAGTGDSPPPPDLPDRNIGSGRGVTP
jgi:hypothetical protein